MLQLIVNADDYGYFPEVSRGIREVAAAGAVTATGILAVAGSWGGRCLSLAGYVTGTGSAPGRPLPEGANVGYPLRRVRGEERGFERQAYARSISRCSASS